MSQARAQIKAVEIVRLMEQRRTAAQTEATNAALQQVQSARDDARASDVAARELRARIAGLVAASRTPGNSTAVGSGTPAAASIDLLADVLRRAEQRAGELAEYADQTRIAGQACERSYDALSAPPTQK